MELNVGWETEINSSELNTTAGLGAIRKLKQVKRVESHEMPF
jgi:hypothetical protein